MGNKSDRTKALIVAKAAVLFNTKGYHGTSMADIMQATGLTKGGIYGNFKKEGQDKVGVKEEIAIAAFNYSVETINEEIGNRTRVIENVLDKLKTVVYFYKERVLNMPIDGGCPLMNTIVEADDNLPILFDLVKYRMSNWQKKIIHSINKGVLRKEIKPEVNAEHFATYFIGCIEGGVLLTRVHREVKYFEIMANELIHKIDGLRNNP